MELLMSHKSEDNLGESTVKRVLYEMRSLSLLRYDDATQLYIFREMISSTVINGQSVTYNTKVVEVNDRTSWEFLD